MFWEITVEISNNVESNYIDNEFGFKVSIFYSNFLFDFSHISLR